MVDVYEQGKEKVTYVKMNAEKVKRVITEHIVNGQVVTEYTIGTEEK
jgi:NADP-reducing hydrogenase subunit HndB